MWEVKVFLGFLKLYFLGWAHGLKTTLSLSLSLSFFFKRDKAKETNALGSESAAV